MNVLSLHDQSELAIETLRWNEAGLLPAIAQDARSGQVLMLAWMSEAALRQTLASGEAHYWSRSRQVLWHKGATSGHVQPVREVLVDCDADCLLLLVEPAGPACHTGQDTCFYRPLAGRRAAEAASAAVSETRLSLATLFDRVRERQRHAPPGSYTSSLLNAGTAAIAKKLGEEAIEVIVAAQAEGRQRLIEESADLIYHHVVLLANAGISLADVEAELGRRAR